MFPQRWLLIWPGLQQLQQVTRQQGHQVVHPQPRRRGSMQLLQVKMVHLKSGQEVQCNWYMWRWYTLNQDKRFNAIGTGKDGTPPTRIKGSMQLLQVKMVHPQPGQKVQCNCYRWRWYTPNQDKRFNAIGTGKDGTPPTRIKRFQYNCLQVKMVHPQPGTKGSMQLLQMKMVHPQPGQKGSMQLLQMKMVHPQPGQKVQCNWYR